MIDVRLADALPANCCRERSEGGGLGQKRSARSADFIIIARRAIHNPQRRSRCQTKEPSGQRPVKLQNLMKKGL